MFRVGQKVVCVWDDWNPSPEITWPLPKKGDVLTIKEIVTEPWGGMLVFDGRPEEYFPWFFRPIDELYDQVDRIEKEGLPAELLEELADELEYAMN